MCTKKLIRLAVPILLLGAIVIGPPAEGKKWRDYWYPASNANCKLAPTGVEPDASGRAKLSDAGISCLPPGPVDDPSLWTPALYGWLNVTAQGLTPGQWYWVRPCTDEAGGWFSGGYADDEGVLDPGPLRLKWPCGLSSTVEVPVTVVNESDDSVLEGILVVNVQV